ncbi:MAG: paraquat-inducible protein A [Opitutaceae bacterium]
MSSPAARFTCPLCGHEHQPIVLQPGESAFCVRCDTMLARGSRWGRDSTLVFTLTGLILAAPALFLPFITAGKFGQERGGILLTGVEGLWDHGMRLLAIWVMLCGAVVPMLLLGVLAGVLLPERMGWSQRQSEFWSNTAHAMGYWAIPEVQVLAVLVALLKLGSLVNVTIGAGFWCYGAMSLSLLIAWRGFMHRPPDLSPKETSPAITAAPANP